MPGLKYVKVFNILRLSMCQGFEFLELKRVYINKGLLRCIRILNMCLDAIIEEF